jgi:hypothetical protein
MSLLCIWVVKFETIRGVVTLVMRRVYLAIEAVKESFSILACFFHLVETLLNPLKSIHSCALFEVIFPSLSVEDEMLEQEDDVENHGDHC